MASLRTWYLPHYPQHPVHVALYTDVANAAFLRQQLLAANPDFDYALLDASMILSPAHLLSAAFLALHAHVTDSKKTRTPHSELVFRLHPNNNIGESYRKFGIGDTSTTILAVKFHSNITATTIPALPPNQAQVEDESASIARHLATFIQGRGVPISETGDEVGAFVHLAAVNKVYKLGGNAGKAPKGSKARQGVVNGHAGDSDRKELEAVVLGLMTVKGL